MEGKRLLVERRSVRRFLDKPVEEEVLKEILEIVRFAPSWANYQIARYTVITDQKLKKRIVEEGYGKFQGNARSLEEAPGLFVLSNVLGKSGHAPYGETSEYSLEETWSMFDSGIAAHQLCLAAFNMGIGTVIQGIFNKEKVSELIELPEDESIAALIPFGYYEGELKTPSKMEINQISRFI